MAVAKVFQSGNSQAVRLPKDFRVTGRELEIFRRGDEIVLREKQEGMLRALELIRALPADVLAARRDDPPEEREPW